MPTHPNVKSYAFRTKKWYKKHIHRPLLSGVLFVFIFSVGFMGVKLLDNIPPRSSASQNYPLHSGHFEKCGSSPRTNCVVDGDTFYLDGFSIRVADIDTPETYGARCDYEADLGAQATLRFIALLNAGPFEVRPIPNRDKDRYGRKLRTVHRGTKSLGEILVREDLARIWDGRRHPWCS